MRRPGQAHFELRVGPLPILVFGIAALYFAREILIPLAFALTLTLILSPAVSWLGKLHVRRGPAVLSEQKVSTVMRPCRNTMTPEELA